MDVPLPASVLVSSVVKFVPGTGERLQKLKSRKPYPRRAASRGIAAPDSQSGEAGEAPSAALQTARLEAHALLPIHKQN